jgi:hypothetical protein
MCFDAIIHLPPTLNTFDVVGSLLRDKTPMSLGTACAPTTVGEVIKMETLGFFLHECISWLDITEVEELKGLISEDIFAKGVQNVGILCPLTSSVTKPPVAVPILLLATQTVHTRPRSSGRNRHY